MTISANTPEDALKRAEDFATEVRSCSSVLFAHEEPARTIDHVVRRLLGDVHRLNERGGTSIPVIALVGKTGEGKGWLARTFLDRDKAGAIRAEIHSGQNDTDRTYELVWFGPEKPFGLADKSERYIDVSASLMLDLGQPYLVGDTPGFSDSSPHSWRLAGLAVDSAPVKILVTSTSQLRDGGVEHFVATMNGATILPVVRFEPEPSDASEPGTTARNDVAGELKKWRTHAPNSRILEPCFMPQQSIYGSDAAEDLMRGRLRAALEPVLADPAALRVSVANQIEERLNQARLEIVSLLTEFRQRVGSPVEQLCEMERGMPGRVLQNLLGEDVVLKAAIRQRLRTDWLDRTPSLCFPFRSFAGLLALTNGAWDKLFFSTLGSVPSLAAVLFKSTRNLRDSHRISSKLHTGLEKRLHRLLTDEFRPVARSFENAISTLLPASDHVLHREVSVRVDGLLDLEATATSLMSGSVERSRAPNASVLSFALTGAALFALSMAGPIFTLYHQYAGAWSHAFGEIPGTWSDFPQPTAAMLFTSLLLSIVPVVFLALIAISWCCRSSRVEKIAVDFEETLEREVQERLVSGSLSIRIDDSRIDSARRLLSMTGSK